MKNKGENKSKDRIIKELHKKIKELEKLETQRKQVEKELRLSEAKFRGLFENVFDGVYQATPDGKIISANPALVRMLGYDSETDLRAIDIAYDLYADPEERRILARKLEKKGELRNAELILKRKDGRQVIVLENARAVCDEQGKVLYYEGTLTDITERKKMEEVLRDRIKELNCFYNISYLVEKPDTSLEEIFQWIVNLIPPAWQYPEITCARIIAKGQGFKTENFRETAWTQDTDIVVHGKPIGTLKVCYLEERPERDEGPFLKEERSLLNAIASRLGKIIERREAEEALRKSEEKYRDSIELAPDAIITLDMKGMITSCNTAAANLSDFSKDEIIGKHFSKLGFLREKDIPKYIELFVSAVAGKIFEPFEIMWYHKDGTARLGEVRFSVIEEEDNVVGIQTIVRDITERKKGEEALLESKNKIEQLHKVAAQMETCSSEEKVYQLIIDATKRILKFTACSVNIVDGDRLETKATSYDEIPEDRYRSLNEGIIGRTYRTGKSYLVDDLRKDKDAKPSENRFQSCVSIPIWNIGVFVTISDKLNAFTREDLELGELLMSHATEALKRIYSEKEIRRSEAKFRGLFENVLDGMYQTTPDGKIISANPALVWMLGYDSEADLLAIDIAHDLYVDPEERKISARKLEEEGELRNAELALKRKDGRHITVLENARAVRDEQGKALYYEGTLTDITERKKSEELLKKQKEELSAFTYTVSHNLKNYITIIQSYAKFLLLKKEGAKENTQKIIDVTKKMNEFVTRQLELADAGRAIGEPKKVDLNTVVDEIGKMYSIEIHPEDLPTITGDPRRLREIFNNLIDNAIKHGGADRIEISSEKKKNSYVICVKDNGRGIPKEDIDKIFDIWYSKTGTGFGLTIVKKIVEAHGGSISVKLKEGKGTIFEIVLPKM